MRDTYWYVGFFVGLLVGVVILLIRKKLFGRGKREYDERQRIAQGQAHAVAFWALIAFLAVVSLVQLLWKDSCFDNFTLSISAILVGIMVYCIVCIIKDAYLPLRESPARFYATGALVIGMNLLAMGANLKTTPLQEDGKFTVVFINLLVAVMYGLILLVYAGKQLYDRRHREEEDA